MTNVLPFPSHPTNRVRQPLSFPAFERLSARVDALTARSSRAGVDRVADCVLALEAACWTDPCILAQRGMGGAPHVAVVMPGYDRCLSPADARTVAETLRADNAFAGALCVALRLDQVADEAERRSPHGGPLGPNPHGTGRRFLVLAAVIAAATALAALIDRLI